MDFAIPAAVAKDIDIFKAFIKTCIMPDLSAWNRKREIPHTFFHSLGEQDWYGLKFKKDRLTRGSALKESIMAEELAKVSPGVTVAALAHVDLGLMGLFLFGSRDRKYCRQRCGRDCHDRKKNRWRVDAEWDQSVCHQWIDSRYGRHYGCFRPRC